MHKGDQQSSFRNMLSTILEMDETSLKNKNSCRLKKNKNGVDKNAKQGSLGLINKVKVKPTKTPKNSKPCKNKDKKQIQQTPKCPSEQKRTPQSLLISVLFTFQNLKSKQNIAQHYQYLYTPQIQYQSKREKKRFCPFCNHFRIDIFSHQPQCRINKNACFQCRSIVVSKQTKQCIEHCAYFLCERCGKIVKIENIKQYSMKCKAVNKDKKLVQKEQEQCRYSRESKLKEQIIKRG